MLRSGKGAVMMCWYLSAVAVLPERYLSTHSVIARARRREQTEKIIVSQSTAQ